MKPKLMPKVGEIRHCPYVIKGSYLITKIESNRCYFLVVSGPDQGKRTYYFTTNTLRDKIVDIMNESTTRLLYGI